MLLPALGAITAVFMAVVMLFSTNVASAVEFDQLGFIGRTYTGTYSGRSASVSFYEKSYPYSDSGPDVCMEVYEGSFGRSYIYLSRYGHIDAENQTISAWLSTVTGGMSSYRPLSVTGSWTDSTLTLQIRIANTGQTIFDTTLDIVGDPIEPTPNPDPDPDPDPDPKPEGQASISFDDAAVAKGEEVSIPVQYTPCNPDSIYDEIESIVWSIDDSEYAEVTGSSILASEDGDVANGWVTVSGLKVGETTISADLSAVGGGSFSSQISIEPKLILPEGSPNFTGYDATVQVNQGKEDEIVAVEIGAKLDEDEECDLKAFLNNAASSLSLKVIENTVNTAQLTLLDTSVALSDDGRQATIKANLLVSGTNGADYGADYALSLHTNAQSDTIRLIVIGYDSDGDAIPDTWERYGLDADGDGTIDLDLPAMGAEVGHRDIVVQVDSMPDCEPSHNALEMVAKVFMDHGYYLHIDAGKTSVDYVTGKQWGGLSKSNNPTDGNAVRYEEMTDKTAIPSPYYQFAKIYLPPERRSVFRQCVFVNAFQDGTSGVTNTLNGQYFMVTKWIAEKHGDLGVAGTFMHELGHSLGLDHGGNESNNFKPNYLSVMNYSYQIMGLQGDGLRNAKPVDRLNYSEWELPGVASRRLV